MPTPFIEFRNIVKTFGGVLALNEVSLAIRKGECHALMGENGAGKSTLGKSLAGIHRPDSGAILIDGAEVRINSPADSQALGIGMVHQELAFCPDLSVAENLAMGHYPTRGGLFSRRATIARAEELLAQIGMRMDVCQPMRALTTAQEQMVQIAAAIGTGARVLVFDEPTSSLSEREAQQLFALIETLKGRGVTMIYVSHRMPEVFRLCDAISVLRDGKYVGTLRKEGASWPAGTQDQVVQMMIGRPVADYLPQYTANPNGPRVLEVKGLTSPGKFRDVSFEIRAGGGGAQPGRRGPFRPRPPRHRKCDGRWQAAAAGEHPGVDAPRHRAGAGGPQAAGAGVDDGGSGEFFAAAAGSPLADGAA
jgi:ABC-type sugar transport system ATPase subunit